MSLIILRHCILADDGIIRDRFTMMMMRLVIVISNFHFARFSVLRLKSWHCMIDFSPIVLVKKKDGSLHICVDYRRLNSVSKVDVYPMPRVDALIDHLGRAQYLSTLDLTRGYWQVPVSANAQHKTAFASPFGLFEFKRMPFGLQGAPATFQRMMDKLLDGLGNFCQGLH